MAGGVQQQQLDRALHLGTQGGQRQHGAGALGWQGDDGGQQRRAVAGEIQPAAGTQRQHGLCPGGDGHGAAGTLAACLAASLVAGLVAGRAGIAVATGQHQPGRQGDQQQIGEAVRHGAAFDRRRRFGRGGEVGAQVDPGRRRAALGGAVFQEMLVVVAQPAGGDLGVGGEVMRLGEIRQRVECRGRGVGQVVVQRAAILAGGDGGGGLGVAGAIPGRVEPRRGRGFRRALPEPLQEMRVGADAGQRRVLGLRGGVGRGVEQQMGGAAGEGAIAQIVVVAVEAAGGAQRLVGEVGVEGAVERLVIQPMGRAAGAAFQAVLLEARARLAGGDGDGDVGVAGAIPRLVEPDDRAEAGGLAVRQVVGAHGLGGRFGRPLRRQGRADLRMGGQVPGRVEHAPQCRRLGQR